MKSTDSSLFKSAGHNRSPFKFRDGVHIGLGKPGRAERDWLNGWVNLQPTIVENNTISHQSSRNSLRDGWIHLLSVVVKNNSIGYQSGRGN